MLTFEFLIIEVFVYLTNLEKIHCKVLYPFNLETRSKGKKFFI